jgi:hypothetical protein
MLFLSIAGSPWDMQAYNRNHVPEFLILMAPCVFWGGGHQGGQDGAEQSLAPASGIVHEFKEDEIVRQL